MATFRFEVQNLIKPVIVAENKESARQYLIDNLADLEEAMINDCYVSEGEEVV